MKTLPMQDIVQASGMSKGAIYHYFKSKQEIVAYLSNYEKELFYKPDLRIW